MVLGEKEYIKSQQKLVDMSLRNIERKIYKLAEVGMGSRVIGRGGTLKVEQYWKTVVEALNGDKLVFKNLDKSLSPFVKEIRTQIDDLSKVLSKYVDDEGARKAIKQGLGNYLTTSYEIFKGSFRAKKDVVARAEKWFEELLERTTHKGRSAEIIAADATKMVKTFMTKGGTLVEGTTAAERLKSISSLIPPEGILKGKVKIPQVLQELMGKVTDPRAIILDRS